MAAAVSTTTPNQTNPNGPISTQQAASSGVVAPAPAAPLGSPSSSSTITTAPTTTPAPSAASYYNQLNQAAPSPTPAPAPAPAPAPSPAPASSGIIQSAKTQAVSAPAPAAGIISSARAPAPTPTPTPAPATATPAPISPLLTQPADYSKPESQQEIDAYNQLAQQAAQTGNYSQLDSIGTNDERNIFGPTFAPGDKANPAFISAQMNGKSTDGIPQWLTPAQVQSGVSTLGANQVNGTNPTQSNPGIIASQKMQPQIKAQTGQVTTGSAPASAANINQDFLQDFGRPAAAAGLQFYQQALAANPNMTADQLNAAILQGAQTQDQLAAASLNGQGGKSNWTNPLLNPDDVQSATTNPNGQDTWDAATNGWTTPVGVTQGAENANGVQNEASTYQPSILGNPTQVNVNAPQTVAGQIANIDNPNSPIMQAARTSALQQANASGLLNSTMAITAGNAAAYNAALPIAEQDATTYNNDAVTNASADNQFAVDNQNAINSANQFNANAQNTLTGQKLTQEMQSATTAQQAGKEYSDWIGTIQQSTMTAGAKNDAEVQAYNTYLQQMQTLAKAGLPDVSGLLQFTGVDPNTGLPDYRDPTTGLYSSSSNGPGAAPTPTPTPTPTDTNPTNNPHR